jgi:hypothetical protein
MYKQGVELSQFGENAVVKVPMTPDGLEAGRRLVSDGIRVNVTLVFSPAQAILAAEIGAYIVSPFIGRIDDAAADGLHALRQICEIYDVQGYDTNVLAASLRLGSEYCIPSGDVTDALQCIGLCWYDCQHSLQRLECVVAGWCDQRECFDLLLGAGEQLGKFLRSDGLRRPPFDGCLRSFLGISGVDIDGHHVDRLGS